VNETRTGLPVLALPDCTRRSFLRWSAATSVPVVLGIPVAAAGELSRDDVPVGVDLETLREDIDDGPGILVARAVAAGWRVVGDETVLKRPEAWQQELVLALARHRVELAAIEAVVDLGRVTFASRSPIVRRCVVSRLDAAIRQARRLRCRHLLVVPGLLPVGEPVSGVGPRVTALMNECQARAGNAGMRIVVERIERRSDQVGVALQES